MTQQSLAKRSPVSVEMVQPQPAAMSPVYLGSIAVPAHEVLDLGRKIALALADIIIQQQLFVNVQGKKHVYVEGWTTMGAMIGVTPREVSSIPLDDGSYEGTVELVRLCDGMVVGRASAVCGTEETWKKREKHARKSMATTRATGKAFRLAFSWIMKLAGYEPTPAEEMPHGWGDSGSKEQAQAVAAEKLAQLDRQGVSVVGYQGEEISETEIGAMADIAEDPLPEPTSAPSVAPTATPGPPASIVGAERPFADPKRGVYLYAEQAADMKEFTRLKRSVGEEAYRRALSYHDVPKSNYFTSHEAAVRCMKDLLAIEDAQAKQRKLKSDQAKEEMDAASLLPSREGSGCDMPISNQIATYVKRLKWSTESANEKMEMHRKAGEDWETIMLRLRELCEREGAK